MQEENTGYQTAIKHERFQKMLFSNRQVLRLLKTRVVVFKCLRHFIKKV